MLIDSVLNMDAKEATSQVRTNETSIAEYIKNNETGEQDCGSVTENSIEEKGAPESDLSNPVECNREDSKKRYSRLKHIIDSDSDDEHHNHEQSLLPQLLPPGGEINESLSVSKMHKKVALIDSDSESDDEEESLRNSKPETARQKPKRLAIFDSDSEEEETKSKEPDRPDEDAVVKTVDANETDVYSFNKKGKLVSENSNYNEIYSRLSALCDPDTSDEENEVTSATNEHESELPYVTGSVKRNKKAEAPKKMTGREAAEQKREILSGSSRRARERQVSLPYHKPKHRSLKEFLQNRPRFVDALPKRAAIKMSNEQLEAMSKNLEEREKKLEEFFKSESESGEESANEINSENETRVSSNVNLVEDDLNSDQTRTCDEQPELEQSNSVHSVTTVGKVSPEENQLKENETTEQKNGVDRATDSEELKELNANENPNEEDVTNSEEDCLNTETSSLNFQFSLDGENCNSEPTNLEEKKLNDLIAKYSDVEEIKRNEDEVCNSVEQTKVRSKLELLKDGLAQYKPKLSGNPDQVIDLDEGVTKPNEVTQLVERFMQHNVKKNHHKTKVHVDVISMVDGEIRKEVLSVPVDLDEMESIAVIEKPGARLKKLRDELQTQMAQRRSELWKQKSLQHDKRENDDENDVKSESYDDPILDDECEFTESKSEASDEELEQEKPRKKLAFADEEAEESDRQESDDDVDEEINEDKGPSKENPEDDVETEENPEVLDGDDESEDTAQSEVKRKRKLRRIVQAFTDDSDEENEPVSEPPLPVAVQKPEQKSKNAFDDSTDTWDDSGPPPNQPKSSHTPRREFSQTRSQLGFLTPVFHLTGLQNFNSGSKFLRESPVTPFDLNVPPSPLPPTSQVLQKKLFDEAPGEEKTPTKKTPSPSKTDGARMETLEEITETTVPSTQDLLEICSGSFSPSKEGSTSAPESTSAFGKESEVLPELISNETEATSTGCKSDGDNDDRIISQLLDEEELENFKKKFASPLVAPSQAPASVSSTKVSRFVFDSSDDEETNDRTVQVKSRAKQKKLVFSDDEEEEVLSEHSDEEKVVEYDSEENEIEVFNRLENIKASDFVENEAELSESDWGGSADEDEKDLDELEFEQGDAEVFDENKVRSDLERIHMRRILDDDNREVRLLQELLLEDGELHGTGRQRQFKWRNIDSVNNDVDGVKEDESGVYLDEYADGENEEQWRKLRYQRELFLKKKVQSESQENGDDETSVSYESQVFKLGQAAIRRSTSQNNNEKPTESTAVKQHHLLVVKRGSFLSRNDEVLTRLAEYSKVTSASTGAAVKNSRKFVFKSVVSTEETTRKEVTVGGTKRKPSDGTPTAIKKLRLSDLSPAAVARSEKSNRVKKLFGNW